MKKLFFIPLFILLTGCGCVIPQIPPQFIYAGKDCSAPIPDYTALVVPSDNCKLSWYIQDPSPGWLLDNTNMIMIVKLRIGDVSGNIREMSFTVTLVDTVKPVFNIDPSLLRSNWDVVEKLYDTADRFLIDLLYFDTILPDDSPSVPLQVGTSYFRGIERKIYPVYNMSTSNGVPTWNADGVLQIDSAVYKNKMLVIRVPPDYTSTHIGRRSFSFE